MAIGTAAARARWRRRGDHAELERQQLVEGEPPEGGVASLEGHRVVGLI